MNWARIVLDGLAMCVVFNVFIALLWTIRPTALSQMITGMLSRQRDTT